VIPYWEQKESNSTGLKTLALLVVSFYGTPNLVRILSSKNMIMATLEDVFIGTASTHQVK